MEIPLLPRYCELPAKDAVIVTVALCESVGAVYVTEVPVVEDRLPTPEGLIDQVTVMPLNALPELSLTLAVKTWVLFACMEKLIGDTLTTVEVFRATVAGRMLPVVLTVLGRYCELPANDAVTVTDVFVVTVGAVYVTEVPVVEDRLPTPAGLIVQLTKSVGAPVGTSVALRATVPLLWTWNWEGETASVVSIGPVEVDVLEVVVVVVLDVVVVEVEVVIVAGDTVTCAVAELG
jgi:hypothetical protein